MKFAERVRQAARGLDTFTAKSLAAAAAVKTYRERRRVQETIGDFYKRGEMARVDRGVYRYVKRSTPVTIRQRLWDVIRRLPTAGFDLDDLEQLTGCNRETIKDFCKWLVKEGYAVRPSRGKLKRVKDFEPVAPVKGRNGEAGKRRKGEGNHENTKGRKHGKKGVLMGRSVRTLMDYIRKHYGVPAKRGMRVKTEQGKGWITGSGGACYVRVRLDGETESRLFHPTDIEYPKKTIK